MRLLKVVTFATLVIAPSFGMADQWLVICGSHMRRADAQLQVGKLSRSSSAKTAQHALGNFRKKYPGYDGVTDLELARAICRTWPGAYPEIESFAKAQFWVAYSTAYRGLRPGLWIVTFSTPMAKASALQTVKELKAKGVDAYAKSFSKYVGLVEKAPSDFDRLWDGTKPKMPAVESVDSSQLPSDRLSAKAIFSRFSQSVVTVVTDTAQGTGFVIDERTVVTCQHVVAGSRSIHLEFANGTRVNIESVSVQDDQVDLALLRTSRPLSTRALAVNANIYMPDVGDKLFVIGSPVGMEQSLTDGLLSAVRMVDRLPDAYPRIVYWQLSTPVSHGSSGSPVFNDVGQVIGVIVGSLKDGNQVNFAISSDEVVRLRNRLR